MPYGELRHKATLILGVLQNSHTTSVVSSIKPQDKEEYRTHYHHVAMTNVSKRLHNTKNRIIMMNKRYQLQKAIEKSAFELTGIWYGLSLNASLMGCRLNSKGQSRLDSTNPLYKALITQNGYYLHPSVDSLIISLSFTILISLTKR